jgi:hypothetical protein
MRTPTAVALNGGNLRGDLVDGYLRALSAADTSLAASLFTDDGIVHSPLYGALPAREFYPALFADTSQANLTLKAVMRGDDQAGRMTVSFWFHFDWHLPSGIAAPVHGGVHHRPEERRHSARLPDSVRAVRYLALHPLGAAAGAAEHLRGCPVSGSVVQDGCCVDHGQGAAAASRTVERSD